MKASFGVFYWGHMPRGPWPLPQLKREKYNFVGVALSMADLELRTEVNEASWAQVILI